MTDKNILKTPSTAVVVLNWNGSRLLREFLPSVLANTDKTEAEVIVADNGSTDDSIEILEHEFPEVRVIKFNENCGFAEGYNKVCRELEHKYIVLLNSDASPSPGWLKRLIDFMESHPDYAAVAPKLLSYKHPEEFEYAGAAGGFIDRYGYPFCRGRIFATCESDEGQYDSDMEVHWASGAALMVRRDLYNVAGGLDKEFFAHMEEIDLCWRFRRMGYKVGNVYSSKVYHLGGGSLPPSSPRKAYLNFRNNLLMLHKNLPLKERRKILFRRRLLDTVAFGNFVAHFNFAGAKAILKAHKDFRRMRKDYPDSMRIGDKDEGLISKANIITQYYLKGRKTFSKLHNVLPLIILPLALTVFASSPREQDPTVAKIINSLKGTDCYNNRVNYRIWLPSAENPIDYTIEIHQKKASASTSKDSFPIDYHIRWEMPDKRSQGFSATFEGNHYRSRDHKLQEYHYAEDTVAFAPGGRRIDGVDYKSQFADFLPGILAVKLDSLLSPDSGNSYKIIPKANKNGRECIKISGKELVKGCVAKEFQYYFDATDMRPVSIEYVSSPGQISEQEVTASYLEATDSCLIISEETLISQYPEDFARREDSYRLKASVGEALPGFSLPTPTGERYSRAKGDGFAHPTVMVYLQPGINTNRYLISTMRKAVDSLPFSTDVIFAWDSKDIDAIETENGRMRPGETYLFNVRKLATECGISNFPTLIFINPSGKITGFLEGVNNKTPEIVTQLITESRF